MLHKETTLGLLVNDSKVFFPLAIFEVGIDWKSELKFSLESEWLLHPTLFWFSYLFWDRVLIYSSGDLKLTV